MFDMAYKMIFYNVARNLKSNIGKKPSEQKKLANNIEKLFEVSETQEDNTFKRKIHNATSENN